MREGRVVGPTRRVGAGGESFPPSRTKRGSSETIGTFFCTYRYPYRFQSTLHCQVQLQSLHGYFVCAHGSISCKNIESIVQVTNTARYRSVQNWQLLTISLSYLKEKNIITYT